jgi:hypothetical protein
LGIPPGMPPGIPPMSGIPPGIPPAPPAPPPIDWYIFVMIGLQMPSSSFWWCSNSSLPAS